MPATLKGSQASTASPFDLESYLTARTTAVNAALDKFLRYREDIVIDWHRRVLTEIQPLQRERGLEVIVTALDSLHSDTVRPALGTKPCSSSRTYTSCGNAARR